MATFKTSMERNEKHLLARIKYAAEKAEIKCRREQLVVNGYAVGIKVQVSITTHGEKRYVSVQAGDQNIKANILLDENKNVTGQVMFKGLEGFEPLDLWRAPDFNCAVEHLAELFW